MTNVVFTIVCDNVVFTIVCAHQTGVLELVWVDDLDLSPV